jgi:hypothetical protein
MMVDPAIAPTWAYEESAYRSNEGATSSRKYRILLYEAGVRREKEN